MASSPGGLLIPGFLFGSLYTEVYGLLYRRLVYRHLCSGHEKERGNGRGLTLVLRILKINLLHFVQQLTFTVVAQDFGRKVLLLRYQPLQLRKERCEGWLVLTLDGHVGFQVPERNTPILDFSQFCPVRCSICI